MRSVVAVLAIAVLAGADAPTDAVKKEMAQLEGEWSLASGEADGNPFPENILMGAKHLAKDGETTVTIDGQVFLKAKYTIDPTKKPRTIDYMLTEGQNKGKTVLGIYETTADTIKFCFAQPGTDRPTEFTAPAGSMRTVSVWKKAAK